MTYKREYELEPKVELVWLQSDLNELERNGMSYSACAFEAIEQRMDELRTIIEAETNQ